jgi:cytochrome c-type biogenesis protein CcmF
MTEAAISAGITGDLYVSLGEQVENSPDGAWGVRIYIKPFIDWIWYGCLIMALGGILALGDKRYRLKLKRGVVPEAVATPEPAPAMMPAPSQPQAGD